jgi:hypothetical protein
MIRIHVLLLAVWLLLITPAIGLAQPSLSAQTEAAWQTFLETSPRDQQSKDFLEPRIRQFVRHLEELEAGTATGDATSLDVSRARNEIRRDYTMLEATIRNLKNLADVNIIDNDADLNLLVSLGEIFGQAEVLARYPMRQPPKP